jgi:hypothetical protein
VPKSGGGVVGDRQPTWRPVADVAENLERVVDVRARSTAVACMHGLMIFICCFIVVSLLFHCCLILFIVV